MKRNFNKMKTDTKKQRGAGLVELMVSIAIGLILILGVSTVFFSVNKTFKDRQGLATLQGSQRMAMSFISAGIHNAGYYPNPLAVSPIAAAVVLVGTENGTTDTLAVRFVAPAVSSASAYQGCSGSTNLTANHVYSDTFGVSGGNLICTEKDITANTTAPVINLIAGVTGLDLLYGVDTTGAGSVTSYKTATAATWGRVKTVRVKLSFTNPLYGQPSQPNEKYLTQTISNLTGP